LADWVQRLIPGQDQHWHWALVEDIKIRRFAGGLTTGEGVAKQLTRIVGEKTLGG
jgi:hypothetical protein